MRVLFFLTLWRVFERIFRRAQFNGPDGRALVARQVDDQIGMIWRGNARIPTRRADHGPRWIASHAIVDSKYRSAPFLQSAAKTGFTSPRDQPETRPDSGLR